MNPRDSIKRAPPSIWIGLAVIVATVAWSFLPGARFFRLLGPLLGAVFLLYGGLFLLMARGKWQRGAKILRRVMQVGFLLLLALFLSVEALILTHAQGDENPTASTAVVFGAGVEGTRPSLSLLARLEAAYRWWSEDQDRVLIVSGGQGPGEDITEAQAMETWLLDRGVPQSSIVKEERSRSTEENVAFSAPLLEERLTPGERVAVVSNEFHLYRCTALVERLGYSAVTVAAPTPKLYLKITYCVREFCSVIFMWLGL